jgi:hypothetical protein
MSTTSSEESYEDQMNKLIKNLPNNYFICEVTKCCNYSTFVLVEKNSSLLDLYSAISTHFECRDIKRVFVKHNNTLEEMNIPITCNLSLKTFIIENQHFFKPIYPVPYHVVYRIYLDDGHVHINETNNADQNNVFNAGL